MENDEEFGAPESVDAGPPDRPQEGVAPRAGAEGPSKEELDERQRKARTTRRPMGPAVEEEAREEADEGSPPDVPPTTPEGA